MTAKSAFITGAASGIGLATARRFAKEGWLICGADRAAEGLDALHEELGPDQCAVYQLDVTDKAAYDGVIELVAQRTDGRLDLLFNNAGIGSMGFFEDIPYEETRRMIDVNLIGVVNGVYAALPLLADTAGSLCFSTSSSAATYGSPRLAIYAATKFAVKGLTEALAVELSRKGVRAADMLPGLIDTPILNAPVFVDGKKLPTQGRTVMADPPADGPFRLIDADVVAETVWDAYHGNRVHWYVPAEIEEIDRTKAQDVEAMRDQFVESMNAADD